MEKKSLNTLHLLKIVQTKKEALIKDLFSKKFISLFVDIIKFLEEVYIFYSKMSCCVDLED